MYSLYHSLLAQHPRQLSPLRCGPSTIAQLHRYFEDVVLENNLSPLMIQSFRGAMERPARELIRIKELVNTAFRFFLFVRPDDPLRELNNGRPKDAPEAFVLERNGEDKATERFAVIADARFSALLASVHGDDEGEDSGDLVIWTFEPDVVYSALEYLMARVTAEHPQHAQVFSKAVRTSMPKATSLQLTLGVTTKLARLLQQQAEREIAVNRIATAIRNSLELESVLHTAANEVGRALNVKYCMVRVAGDLVGQEVTKHYISDDVGKEGLGRGELLNRVESISADFAGSIMSSVVDGDNEEIEPLFAYAVVPLIHQGEGVGMLMVHSDDQTRTWAENELLLLHTVADQLIVAANQAHMFAQMEQMALTDPLTGCYNRRSFEMQLERDLHLATRMRQPLSLIMLDLDNFKTINDVAGHEIGDLALRLLADTLRAELRAVDTAVRFGGDEFAVILPQADKDGALVVAERLRRSITQTEVPGYGLMSASFGLASFPFHASSRDTLVVAADQALYISKRNGRNQVSSLPPVEQRPSESEFSTPEQEPLADAVK